MTIDKRYDFVLFFDVQDGNPNGDPDAGNLPRIDAETGMGLVTDVCLKRKVRNYIQLTKDFNPPFDIYVKEKSVLGHAHNMAFSDLGIALGSETRVAVPEALVETLGEYPLPEDMSLDEEDGHYFLVVASTADIKAIKADIKEAKPEKELKKFLENSLKGVKARKPTAEETEEGRGWMCSRFYDIRTFGAVLSLKSAPNCGQVRGPVQLTFARSVQPIVALEHSITRMAVATEAEAEKQGGDNRTMGRKYTVPYGLYRAHGFVSAPLASKTKFGQEDLDLLWQALEDMFDHDHSAARGFMTTRRLVIFEHSTVLGNAHASDLFERVTWKRTSEGPARSFTDYEIQLDGHPLTERRTVVPVR